MRVAAIAVTRLLKARSVSRVRPPFPAKKMCAIPFYIKHLADLPCQRPCIPRLAGKSVRSRRRRCLLDRLRSSGAYSPVADLDEGCWLRQSSRNVALKRPMVRDYSSRFTSCCSFALGERSRGRRRPFRRSSVFESARRRSEKRLSCSTPIFTYHNAISVRFQQPVF